MSIVEINQEGERKKESEGGRKANQAKSIHWELQRKRERERVRHEKMSEWKRGETRWEKEGLRSITFMQWHHSDNHQIKWWIFLQKYRKNIESQTIKIRQGSRYFWYPASKTSSNIWSVRSKVSVANISFLFKAILFHCENFRLILQYFLVGLLPRYFCLSSQTSISLSPLSHSLPLSLSLSAFSCVSTDNFITHTNSSHTDHVHASLKAVIHTYFLAFISNALDLTLNCIYFKLIHFLLRT